MNGGQATPAA
ncbi:hypothetical protein VTH06DRAFT_3051 [Thermothelomyces fergusii]